MLMLINEMRTKYIILLFIFLKETPLSPHGKGSLKHTFLNNRKTVNIAFPFLSLEVWSL